MMTAAASRTENWIKLIQKLTVTVIFDCTSAVAEGAEEPQQNVTNGQTQCQWIPK